MRVSDNFLMLNVVREFPFDDHNPCPLAMVLQFCKDVVGTSSYLQEEEDDVYGMKMLQDEWLESDPQNVAVIHCKAGKVCLGVWTGIVCIANVNYRDVLV